MPTHTATTTLTGAAAAADLAEMVERLRPAPTALGSIIIDEDADLWEIAAHFSERPDQAGLALAATLHRAQPFALSRLDDRDWVAQVRRELTPVHAGRFVVYGGHDRHRIPANLIGLQIEAAMAFGTGHHATTQGCLRALDGLVRRGLVARNVADVGTGTGVLAMAAARVFPGAVLASDIDPLATSTAVANVRANRLAGRVLCVTAPGLRHPLIAGRAPFDLVFANILAAPLRRLAGDMAALTAPGSRLILSGILNRQAKGVLASYAARGFVRDEIIVIGDWSTLVLRRPGGIA